MPSGTPPSRRDRLLTAVCTPGRSGGRSDSDGAVRSRLDWSGMQQRSRTRTHHAPPGRGTAGPRAKQRAYLHRRAAGGRRPLRAARAAAHRRRRRRRPGRPAPREAAPEHLPRPGQGRGGQGGGQGGRREPRRLRRRAHAAPGAQPRGGARDAGRRPHRDDPRHLRRRTRTRAEGKLQVELAQLEYNLARMRGLWTHLERLGGVSSGGIGTRGPGESQIETDRRLARDRIAALRAPARAASRARARRCAPSASARTCRRSRSPATRTPASRRCSTRSPAPRSASATASSTRSTRRRARCALDGRPYLLTDTVGFIRKLPHQLVDAFGATLEETRLADLDPARRRRLGRRGGAASRCCAPSTTCSRRSAPATGRACSCSTRPTRSTPSAATELRLPPPRRRARLARSPARGSRSCGERDRARRSRARCGRVELLLPFAEGGRLAELHDVAGDLEREDTAEGVRVRARVPAPVAERYARFAVADGAPTGRAARVRRGRRLGATAAATAAREARRPPPATRRAVLPARAHDGDAGLRPLTRRGRRRSARASARRSAPASRSSCRPGTPAWCCRARAWRRATASRSSTRPG